MKALISIVVDVETGSPNLEEIKVWLAEIISYGVLNCSDNLKNMPIKKANITILESKII